MCSEHVKNKTNNNKKQKKLKQKDGLNETCNSCSDSGAFGKKNAVVYKGSNTQLFVSGHPHVRAEEKLTLFILNILFMITTELQFYVTAATFDLTQKRSRTTQKSTENQTEMHDVCSNLKLINVHMTHIMCTLKVKDMLIIS